MSICLCVCRSQNRIKESGDIDCWLFVLLCCGLAAMTSVFLFVLAVVLSFFFFFFWGFCWLSLGFSLAGFMISWVKNCPAVGLLWG